MAAILDGWDASKNSMYDPVGIVLKNHASGILNPRPSSSFRILAKPLCLCFYPCMLFVVCAKKFPPAWRMNRLASICEQIENIIRSLLCFILQKVMESVETRRRYYSLHV